MITKELFKETIEEIYKFHQKLDLIDKTGLHGISDDLVDVSYEDQLIKLLSSEFDNPEEADEIIAWWIYETEFGNKKQLFLDTPECLYDFLKGEY